MRVETGLRASAFVPRGRLPPSAASPRRRPKPPATHELVRPALVLIGAAAASLAVWMRLAPVDPARWQVDPLTAEAAGQKGWLVRDGGDAAATRIDAPAAEVLARLDAIAMDTPRTRRIAGSLNTTGGDDDVGGSTKLDSTETSGGSNRLVYEGYSEVWLSQAARHHSRHSAPFQVSHPLPPSPL